MSGQLFFAHVILIVLVTGESGLIVMYQIHISEQNLVNMTENVLGMWIVWNAHDDGQTSITK